MTIVRLPSVAGRSASLASDVEASAQKRCRLIQGGMGSGRVTGETLPMSNGDISRQQYPSTRMKKACRQASREASWTRTHACSAEASAQEPLGQARSTSFKSTPDNHLPSCSFFLSPQPRRPSPLPTRSQVFAQAHKFLRSKPTAMAKGGGTSSGRGEESSSDDEALEQQGPPAGLSEHLLF